MRYVRACKSLEQQLQKQAETAWREEHSLEPLQVLQQQSAVTAVADRPGDMQDNEQVTAWKKVGCRCPFATNTAVLESNLRSEGGYCEDVAGRSWT